MQDHGYNIAYPITLDEQKTLVDGLHRLDIKDVWTTREQPTTIPAPTFTGGQLLQQVVCVS